MAHSSFRLPGDDILQKMRFPEKTVPDALTIKRAWPSLGRGSAPGRAPKEGSEEPEAGVPLIPAPEPEPASGPQVILSNPAWGKPQGEFDGTITVSVDADLSRGLEHLTRVDFEVWPEVENGRAQVTKQTAHLRDGRASAAFTLSRPASPAKGNPVDTCDFRFRAKHSRSRPITGPALPAVPGREGSSDGVILYSPALGEYLVFDTEAEFRPLLEEVRRMNGLRAKSRQAWEKTDPEQRYRALEEVAREAAGAMGSNAAGPANSMVEELLLIKGNDRWGKLSGWNYIRAHDREDGRVSVEGHYRRWKTADAQKRLDALLKRGPEKQDPSPLWQGKFAAHLLASRPRSGAVWEWRSADVTDGKSPEVFRYTAEAAALRYLAGWDGLEGAFDPRKMKLRFGTSGQATASLFEGKAAVSLELPDARGVNVVGWLRGVKHGSAFLLDPKRQCLVKLRLEGSLSVFVGATVQAALTLSLERLPKEEVAGSAGAFLGGQARASGFAEAKWSAGPSLPFRSLGKVGMQAGVSAGAGAEGRLKIEYEGCRFRFEMSAAAAWGLGARQGFLFEVDVAEGWKLIGHLLDCVDFHFVAEISAAAYRAYANYAFATLAADIHRAQAHVDWANDRVGRFQEWLGGLGGRLEAVKKMLCESSAQRSILRMAPPQALGQALRTIMRTREIGDAKAIRYLLHSTVRPGEATGKELPADHKLKWTLRYVSGLAIPEEEGPERESMKEAALKAGVERIRASGNGSALPIAPLSTYY
ncbi:MAG: hypothetical protein JWO30_4096 [Fibrobacteres bacterium]|nr:hypothetical protein [Fibrobacterota bacterium]